MDEAEASRRRSHGALFGIAIPLLVLALIVPGACSISATRSRPDGPPRSLCWCALCDIAGCAIRPLRDRRDADLSIDASDLQADPAHRGLLILTATMRNRAA